MFHLQTYIYIYARQHTDVANNPDTSVLVILMGHYGCSYILCNYANFAISLITKLSKLTSGKISIVSTDNWPFIVSCIASFVVPIILSELRIGNMHCFYFINFVRNNIQNATNYTSIHHFHVRSNHI